MDKLRKFAAKWLRIEYDLVREALAEFIGTAFLIVIGDGSVAQSVLSNGTGGQALSIHIAWALAVTLAVFISGNVSGGHINPAISLTMWILGRISAVRLLVYSLAQYVGAIFGASLVYAVYYDALKAFDGGNREILGPTGTGGIFCTYPQEYLTVGGGLGDQIFGTCILALCVLAITDPKNAGVPKYLAPVLVGSTVAAIGITYGYNCGYAINPARDLGPRIFTAFAGWGIGVFSFRNYKWFWIPIVGPYIGAVLGGLSYQLTVGNHWPTVREEEDKEALETRQSSLDVNVSTAPESRS